MSKKTEPDPPVAFCLNPSVARRAQRAMRVCVAALAAAGAVLAVLLALIVPPAGAQTTNQAQSGDGCQPDIEAPDEGEADAPTRTGVVRVLKVSGLIDPIEASLIERNLGEVAALGPGEVQAVVLQLNTNGVSLSDERFSRLLDQITASPVPVIAWAGPSSARVRGDSGAIALAAHVRSVAPGARLDLPASRYYPPGLDLPGPDASLRADDATGLVGDPVSLCSETLNALIVRDIDDLDIPQTGTTLDTARFVEGEAGQVVPELTADVRFSQIGLTEQLLHTVSSPPVAYLLLVIGLVLIVFEFYTGGVGVAGVVGAGSLLLAAYGLWALPTTGLGLGLIVFSMFAFAIDVQTGVARVWSGIGTVCFVIGSVTLYDGMSISWLTLTACIAGTLLMMLGGVPAVVRSRFSTPTIGRDHLLGRIGEAVTDIDHRGVVKVDDARWKAFTNRATPIAAGESVRVTGIEGIYLEIEPEEGGARDYRERSSSAEGDAPAPS